MSGFDNETMYANNYDFRGVQPVVPQVTTAGQLPIGTGASPAIEVGSLTSPDGSIDIGYSSPNITLQADGALADSFPTDDGTATPNSGVLKILGSSSTDYTQSGLVTHSDGTANEIYLENRLWNTKFVVDGSATIGDRGSYQTITAATAEASSGDTIFIRSGTYTEDFTAKAGVTYIGFSTLAGLNEVTIVGKVTLTGAGQYEFSSINFQTNSDFAISCTGANNVDAQFFNCGLTGQNNTILQFTNSNGSSKIDIYSCNMDLKTTGIAYFSNSASGTLGFTYTIGSNSGGSTTASTQSAGTMRINYTTFLSPYTTSGSSIVTSQFSTFNTAAQNVVPWNQNSTNTLNSNVTNSFFSSGSAACMTLGAGSSIFVGSCAFYTSGANLTTGTGEIKYSGISSLANDTAVLNNTTKTALTVLPYATSAAAESTSVRGSSSFDSSKFTVTNGFVTTSGTGIGNTITGNSGGALSPTAGNWNIQGGNGITTSGAGSTLTVTTNGFPTVQNLTSGTGATYTTPANCKWIRIRAWGGGGGGSGSGTTPGAPTGGAATTFSGGTLSAGGGAAAAGAGGASSGGNVANITGQSGQPRPNNSTDQFGGCGAPGFFGGGGTAGNNAPSAGGAAQANSGAGGGGAGCAGTAFAGSGGSAGGYVEHIITSPAASYTYTIGAGGSGGSAGTSGAAGGNGGSGYITVEEHYI